MIGYAAIELKDKRLPTDVVLKFSVEAGKINYIGEILNTGKSYTDEEVVISDFSERDIKKAKKINPLLDDIESVVNLAQKHE